MNKKILITDYASFVESRFFPNHDRTYKLYEANVVVNPQYGVIRNRLIVINLPIEVPLEQLIGNNTVISRFPIGYGIPVVGYNVPEEREEVSKEDYSCLILNKHMLTDMSYLKKVSNQKFLLGISEVIEDQATLVGQIILSTKVEDVK